MHDRTSRAHLLLLALALAPELVWAGEQPAVGRTRPSDAQLLKQVAVSAAMLMAARPELDRDTRTATAMMKIFFAIQLFESLSGPSDLEALASLSPYRLGAAGSEVFECVVLGKGAKIRGSLLRLSGSTRNECTEGVGKGPEQASAGMCLAESEYRDRLRELIAEIDGGESCEPRKRVPPVPRQMAGKLLDTRAVEVIRAYVAKSRPWSPGEYRVEYRGRDGTSAQYWIIHSEDERGVAPGGGKSFAVEYDVAKERIVKEYGFQ